MPQRFYQKASVQVALITGVVLIIVAAMNIGFNYSDVKTQNRKLENENKSLNDGAAKATAEIQRLETLLTPFRTIALEKFAGDEKEALRKLADQIVELQARDQVKTKRIESLEKELTETKALAEPARLAFAAYNLEQSEAGPRVLLQFKPTKNERLGVIEFQVSLPDNTTAVIKKIASIRNPIVGEQAQIAPDGKSARDSFTLLGTGSPVLELTLSEPTAFSLSGNYLETGLRFEMK